MAVNESVLSLKLNFNEYDNKPKCTICGERYKLFQKFFRVFPDGDGGFVFFFASPEHGFAQKDKDYEEISPEKVEALNLPPSYDAFDKEDKEMVLKLFFMDKDVRKTWRRLRSLYTRRYIHPEEGKEKSDPCPNSLSTGEKYRTNGPPKTVFMWAEPLFVALYGCGLSYREIAAELRLASPEQPGVHNSVGRRIQHYQQERNDAKLELLHQFNLRKYTYSKDERNDWDIHIKGTIDQATLSWLERLADHYSQTFAVKSYASMGVLV
jgi:hypothetical protein